MSEMSATEKRQAEAFRRFLQLLPHGKDIELVILKAHLLLEEQVRQIIDERLKNPAALARLQCHQAICLAQAFFPKDHDPFLWASLKELNSIRNDIAHKLQSAQLQRRLEALIEGFPSGFADSSDRFELTLWSMFVAISGLVETPSARVIDIVPRNGP